MPDPIRDATRRVVALTSRVIEQKTQLMSVTILSRNPDGTLNADDGKGGCVLILPPMNARVGDRTFVDVRPAAAIGTGALIGVSGMPTLGYAAANTPQLNQARPLAFIDDAGNIYHDTTGAKTGTGGTPTADVDTSFGYSFSSPNCFVGASPSYTDLQIGTTTPPTGYQGETYSSNNTVLCRGVGSSIGLLMGIEVQNTSPATTVWTVRIRDASTFAIIATNSANYIDSWIQGHPTDFSDGIDTNWDVHVSPDPVDGSFWINLGGNTGTATAPMFNVKAEDGARIRTVTLDTSDYNFFRRAHRVVPA